MERAFALLKGKWTRLKSFPSYCLDYVEDSIIASMILHNFTILEGDDIEVGSYICPWFSCFVVVVVVA